MSCDRILYKKSAWQVFGAQSFTKHSSDSGQLRFDFDGIITLDTDTSCFHAIDIAKYLQGNFKGVQSCAAYRIVGFVGRSSDLPVRGISERDQKRTGQRLWAKIEQIIRDVDWLYNRGFLFLAPCATQSNWTTLENMKKTQSIDVWYLFPFSALNCMLTKNGKFETWEEC